MGLSAAVTSKVVAFLCGDEIGMESPEEILQLSEATLQRVDQLLPMLKRKNFRAAVAKLKAEADAASAAADAEAAAAVASASAAAAGGGGGGGGAEAAAAAVGKKAREELSPEQRKALDEQTSDAAEEGDTAKVLKSIGEGGDMEYHNPQQVSE